MSNLSHHQRQLLRLMGIQPWVEVATPCVKMQHSTIWRDNDVNGDMTDELASSIHISTTRHQSNEQQNHQINHQSNHQLNQHTEQQIDREIGDSVDEHLSLINSQQFNIAKQSLLKASNHQHIGKNQQDNDSEVDLNQEITLHGQKFEQNIFVASCMNEQMVLMAQFDVDIQVSSHAQREDVQLWQNIRKFFNQTQIRLAQKEIQHQVLVWSYDFIDIEPNMMSYFQQGYIEAITQQKKVLLLGDWQGSDIAEHWQQLPSLTQMLQHADAKRQVYRAMMAVMQ